MPVFLRTLGVERNNDFERGMNLSIQFFFYTLENLQKHLESIENIFKIIGKVLRELKKILRTLFLKKRYPFEAGLRELRVKRGLV